jgi:hypothetical protein
VTGDDACARCGTRLAAGQEYCLECGQRHVPQRRRLHWLVPAGAAALVAAGGAAAAIAAGADEGGSSTIVALTPLRPAAAQSAGTGDPKRLVRWPRRDGYTIVLTILPSTAGATTARNRALAALAAGVPDVGVLDSSRFSSLHPGYWIVFSGVFRTLDEAIASLPRAARHSRTAYAQEVSR